MSSGRIVEIIGAVIDVEFERDNVPQVYDALTVDDTEITLEVQQQLGDGVVRTIALGSTEGLSRGLIVQDTGAPVSVPVGTQTLGRMSAALSVRKSVCRFTAKHPPTKNFLQLMNC